MMLKLRAEVLLIAVLFSSVMFSGCSFSYTFDFSGFVKNAKDGKPIAGAKIYSLYGDIGIKPGPAREPIAVTKADGRISFVVTLSNSAKPIGGTGAKWALLIVKEGYADSCVDLGFVRWPDSPKDHGSVSLEVTMSEAAAVGQRGPKDGIGKPEF